MFRKAKTLFSAIPTKRTLTINIPHISFKRNELEKLFLDSVVKSRDVGEETKQSLVSRIKVTSKQNIKLPKMQMSDVGLFSGAMLYTPGYIHLIQNWLNSQFNSGQSSIYDQAADAVYNATHIGGGKLHRLFDGGHSITGMWDAARKASTDDSITEEVLGFAQAYFKDFITTVGMPIPMAPNDPSQYEAFIDQVNSFIPLYDIPRDWFGDIFQQSAAETVAPSIALVILMFRFNKGEAEEFSKIAVHCLGFAAFQGNPLALPIFLIALARGFIKAKKEKDYKGFLKGAAQGGAAQLLIVSASWMIGGPKLTGILISIFILVMLKKIYECEITKETINRLTRRIDETLRTLISNPIGTAQ